MAGAAYFVFSAGVNCQYDQYQYNQFDPLDTLDVALHGLVNFGGGVVNAASGMVNGLTGVANWGNNTCVSLGVCVDIPDIPAIPTVPIWGDYDLYRWSSYSGSATLQLGVVVASAGIGSGGLTADAGTALLNASGINLLRAGAGKLTSLWRAGETGTEAVSAVSVESAAASSLAADFTSGAGRAQAALANAEHNATTAPQWFNGTSKGADAVAAERATQAAADTAGRELTTYYPPNRGFLGNSSRQTLEAGTRIDRFGREGGTFVSPTGTPLEMRSLPPGAGARPYNVYEVVEPITVDAGTVAPWHGRLGLGTQYELPASVAELIERGLLKAVN